LGNTAFISDFLASERIGRFIKNRIINQNSDMKAVFPNAGFAFCQKGPAVYSQNAPQSHRMGLKSLARRLDVFRVVLIYFNHRVIG
jgi:hypothetical protein